MKALRILALAILAFALAPLSHAQFINSAAVPNANFNSTLPAAQSNYTNCLFQNSGPNVTVECPSLSSGSSSGIVDSFTVGTGGVTANTLVQTDTSNPLKVIASTGGVYGVALTTVAAAGTVQVQRAGRVSCVADNNFTAGDFAVVGTSTAIDCKDSGITSAQSIPLNTRIIGAIQNSGLAGALMTVDLDPSRYGTQVSGSAVSGTTITGALYASTTNCAGVGTAANPSVVTCGAAPAGMFSCATAATTGTCVVDTTAVTANSVIQIVQDAADGTPLSVTCNTANVESTTKPVLLSKSAGTSFTINLGTVTTNPGCFEYTIIN
jgi:hypothetical protein